MSQHEQPKIRIGVKRFTLAKYEGDFVPGKEPIAMITGGDGTPSVLLARFEVEKLTPEEMAVLDALMAKAAPAAGIAIPSWDDALAHTRKSVNGA
jgi:hypothetical protein